MRPLYTSAIATGIVFLGELATSSSLAAQNTRYKLIDIGTLGGPSAHGPGNGPGTQLINGAGTVAGAADTPAFDPDCGCFVSQGFRFQDGTLTDLPVLAGGEFSVTSAINARGWIAGSSETGDIDPVTGVRADHAVLWRDGGVLDLGTLGTGVESDAMHVKDSGQVVGFSTVDTSADPFGMGFGPFGSPTHAFAWKNGILRDLGTLGGPDSWAGPGCNTQREDLVAGSSYVGSTPNADTGVPTLDPFLWENGRMIDLGSLGGDFSFAQCSNDRGQVIGQSSPDGPECFTGDPGCHAFLWNEPAMTDLGTLGGSSSFAFWLNEEGQAVGGAYTEGDESFHAALWSSGTITDLGTLPGDCVSNAWAINARGQIVGHSYNCETGVLELVLWERGSVIDLGIEGYEPMNINDRGEITGVYLPPGCSDSDVCSHAFLLVPCDPGSQGCDHGRVVEPGTEAGPESSASRSRDSGRFEEIVARWRSRLTARLGSRQLGPHANTAEHVSPNEAAVPSRFASPIGGPGATAFDGGREEP